MRILLAHDFYQNSGGEDVATLAEKRMLDEHGDHVYFYMRDNKEIDGYSVRERLALPFNAMYSQRTRREMGHIVRNFRPDVAYIQNQFPLISPSIYHALRHLQVPTVQVVHDFRLLCPNGLFYTEAQICERCKDGNYVHAVRHRCYRNSYFASATASLAIGLNRAGGMLRKISAFMCLTEFSKLKLIEAGVPGKKIFIRPHYIDVPEVRPRVGNGHYALFLGRLSPEKGLWTLVRAFEQFKWLTLKVVGTGPLEGELRRYVRDRAIQNIEMVGFKEGPEKWELLLNSSFVIVPSECYETFCLVVMEAYAAGKPVIGSDLGSLPFVIENGKSGLLFRAGNSEDLQDKIRELLAHPGRIREMGNYGRTLATTKYDIETVYRRLRAIFLQVIAKGTGTEEAL